MATYIKLKDTSPMAEGGVRWVFQHPEDQSLIIKTVRWDRDEALLGHNPKWYKKAGRYGIYRSYIREINEYVASYNQHNSPPCFLQQIEGLVHTDYGLGIISKAIKDNSGKDLAPTLIDLIQTGKYDATATDALETFFGALLESPVVINDLNPRNLVYAHSAELDYYFVLIDGLGDNSFIPLKSIFPKLNRRAKLKRFKALRVKISQASARIQ